MCDVLRSVDRNWTDGRIGDYFGTFSNRIRRNECARQTNNGYFSKIVRIFIKIENSLTITSSWFENSRSFFIHSIHCALSTPSIPPTSSEQPAPQMNSFSSDSSSTESTSPNSSIISSRNTCSNSSTAPSSPITHQKSPTTSKSHCRISMPRPMRNLTTPNNAFVVLYRTKSDELKLKKVCR